VSEANVELVTAAQPGPEVDLVAMFRDERAAGVALAAIAPHLADDFEAVGHGGVTVLPRPGVEGLRAVWLDWLSPWESYRTETEEVVDLGDRVLVLVHDFGRRAGIDEEVPLSAAAIWTLRDGRITRADFYADRDEALAAATVEPA
jgi:ketosteroid isomerase-like protein